MLSLTAFLCTGLIAKTIQVPADYPTIQQAIDDANSWTDDVLVAPGTYVVNIDFKGKVITVKSSGGATNTVIDGGQVSRVVTFVNNEPEYTVLDGFTITNGSESSSGGIRCQYASPTITNNIITGNTVTGFGAGIDCMSSDAVITNNTISYNTTKLWGAGIACRESSDAHITGNLIEHNDATDAYNSGGGIYIWNSSPEIKNNTITGNTSNGGSGIDCHGTGTAVIENNLISLNTTNYAGGGLGIWENATPTVTGNTIEENSASEGGGIYVHGAGPTIRNNKIRNNWGDQGGGILCQNTTATIVEDNEISENSSYHGAGLNVRNSAMATIEKNDIHDNKALASGVGIHCENNSTPTITNNTVCSNTAGAGGGLSCNNASPVVTNTIFWDNYAYGGPHEIHVVSASPVITYSDVKGGFTGQGNIDSDPFFLDASNGDYHLVFVSPCKDKGDNQAQSLPSLDFEGDSRIAYNDADMGADEFSHHLYYTGTATPGGTIQLKLARIFHPASAIKLRLRDWA